MTAALEGIRVIDFTHDQAGPSSTQMLAWLGADVIKIERRGLGDRSRNIWYTPRDGNESYFYLLLNHNKRSITLDLKSAKGKEIARRLIAEADVVAENLGPGVMDRLGLGWEDVRKLNPRCVYASVKGFGSEGPYSNYKCFEMVAQAMSGAMSTTGYPDGPPTVNGAGVGDSGTGMHLALAMTAALLQRERTGRGQLVEVAMQETVLNLTRVKYVQTLATGEPIKRTGNRSPSRSYSGLLQCAGDRPDDSVFIMIQPDSADTWPALLKIIGRPELEHDERFATPAARFENYDELTEIIESWTRPRDKREVHRLFASAGIPCGAVLDTAEVLADPHLRARGMVQDIDHPTRGRYPTIASPLRLSDSQVPLRRPPLLGENTEEVLTQLAGYTPEEVTQFKEEGIV
jgi:formyl-CoA transferase